MDTKRRGIIRPAAAVILLLLAIAAAAPLPAQEETPEDTRYMTVTLRGKLNDPATGKPMEGAVVRFTSTDESGGWVEARTDAKGEFALEGLTFGNYAVEITTSDGEKIRGINSFPVGKDRIQVTLKVSERVASTTTVQNEPVRFAAVVEVSQTDWKRFWREFGIFFGIAIGAGAAAR